MKRKILFRADGNATIGLGHLYRLFSVLEMLKGHFECIYLTRENSTINVVPKEYTLSLIPENINTSDEPKWLSARHLPSEHIVIADGYWVSSEYQKQLKTLGFTLVYIDDLTSEHMYADLVINHSPHVQKKHYSAEPHTRFALGTPYSILRPKFLEQAHKNREIKVLENIFVSFGGSDVHDLTYKLLEGLLPINKIKEFHILLGAAYNFTRISKLARKHKERVFLYRDLNEEEIIALGMKCHLGIVPTSSISYELCSIKMPIIGGHYVDNQEYIYRAFLEEELIFDGGDFRSKTVDYYGQLLEEILKKPISEINDYIKRQKQMFDGKSGERILNQMHLLAREGETVREANLEDMELLFNWANNEEVRRNAINSNQIIWQDHKKWFLGKLKNKDTLILILEDKKIPVGQVRFDKVNEHFEIDYSVESKYRGKGYGSALIDKGIHYLIELKGDQKIVAKVLRSNVASRRIFEKQGFSFLNAELNHGESYDVFCLQTN